MFRPSLAALIFALAGGLTASPSAAQAPAQSAAAKECLRLDAIAGRLIGRD